MRKCKSAKVNMCKLRKCDAKDFAFYISPSGVDLSHFRIISKMCEFSNATLVVARGNVRGETSRSQNVRRTASRTQREGVMPRLPTHGDAYAAFSLYVYSHCSLS